MKAGFIQDLAKKYVYYLTFLLNPEERTKSTILTKVEKYKEFTGIFDELPTKLTKGQEFVYNVFKCDDIRLKDLKDLLEDHFKNDIRDFFKLLKSRDLEIGDLFLHDNFWLASPDCVGKECYEHSIDNLNSGKYFCKVYEECNDHECLKYLKIDIRNTIKAKMAKKRIDLYKGITTTSDDVNSFLNMFKNSKECASLDEEQQTAVLENFNNMFSTNDTVEQIVEDVFYKDGKNYNCECYDNSDSDSDEDTADDMFNSFKRTKKTFKKMKGGNKRTNYSNYTHHDYDETHIRKIEREIIEQFKNINYLGLTTQDILKTSTKNWRDEVFRGGKKQMGGEPPIDDINTVAIIKKCVFVKAGWVSDVKDCNRYEVVFVDIENISDLRDHVNEDVIGDDYRPINKAISNISNMKSIWGKYFEYWKVYSQQENGKEGEVVGKINSVIKAKINQDSRFSNMDKNDVYDKIIKNSKEVEQWFTTAQTQFGTVENIVNPLTAASIEYKGENYKDDTTQPDKHDIIPSSKSKDIQFIILESKCTGVLYSTCKWSIILENETDNDKLIKMYTALYGKNWKFYTRKETEEANSILDAAIKTKIINYYQTKSVNPAVANPAVANPAVANPAEQPATADAKPEETAPSGLSDKELADIANRLIEQGKQKEKEICGDVTSYRVHSCNIQPLKKENIDLTEQKTACDSVDDLLGTSVLGKKASVQLKKACEFKSKASNKFKRLMEEAIQLKMPETTTFAEWIWYGTIYQLQKYVNDHVKDNVSLDAATRQKYTEWLSTRGKETDNWVDYGKATLERTKKIISKSSLLITDDGRKAAYARGMLLMADAAPWIGTFLLMMVKNPRLLRVVLDALVKIKIRMCNNLKISQGNFIVVSKPKTLEEEIQELLKSVNVWALSYVPPAFKHIETGITMVRAVFLFSNTFTKAFTFGYIDLESWIIWIFGIIILSSKDMAEELIQSMILYDNLNSIIQLFDIMGCLNTPYCLNIAPTRNNLSIELYDPNATYDYTFGHFFKKDNNLKSIFNDKNWFPRTYNQQMYYGESDVIKANTDLSTFNTNIDNYKLNINEENKSTYVVSMNEGFLFGTSSINNFILKSNVGMIKSKCFWCTNQNGEFTYLFSVNNQTRTVQNMKQTVSEPHKSFIPLPFKGTSFDIETVNINYYSGNLKTDKKDKFSVDLTDDIEAEIDKNGRITKLFYREEPESDEVSAYVGDKYELDMEYPILKGQDNIPATINNFDRLIMELAGTNPITCPNGEATLQKEQLKMAGLKMPLGWYNHADKKLFQNKYKYRISAKDDKINIKFINHWLWGDLFTSAYPFNDVVSFVKSSQDKYNYGKDNWNILLSIMQDKLKAAEYVMDAAYKNIFGNKRLWEISEENLKQLEKMHSEEMNKYLLLPQDTISADVLNKPMYEHYFLVLDLTSAENKNFKDMLSNQMDIIKKDVHSSFKIDLYSAIAFKTKFISNNDFFKSNYDFEVSEIYFIPTHSPVHSIINNTKSPIDKCVYNAFVDVFNQEYKTNSGISYLEFDLYAVFDFVNYDMHSEIGEKYKVKDMVYKHPDDQAQIVNALNTLLDNLIVSEQSHKTFSKKYFPNFHNEQAILADKKKASWFQLRSWTDYFVKYIDPELVKEVKSIAKLTTDALKHNYDSFTKGVNEFKWDKLSDEAIKELNVPDAQKIYDETHELWVQKNISSIFMWIYISIGDYWVKYEDKDIPAYSLTDSQKYMNYAGFSTILNNEYQPYSNKDNRVRWEKVNAYLSKIDIFTTIMKQFTGSLGPTDMLSSILGIKELKTLRDVWSEHSNLNNNISDLRNFLTRFGTLRPDIKKKPDIDFKNIQDNVDKLISGPVNNSGGNKHKNTKRSYENVPHKKSNRYTRRILYQDTHYNTQA